MRTDSITHCDRCGIKIAEYEYILQKRIRPKKGFFNGGIIREYDATIGEYCADCGHLISESANVSRINQI